MSEHAMSLTLADWLFSALIMTSSLYLYKDCNEIIHLYNYTKGMVQILALINAYGLKIIIEVFLKLL